MHKDQRKSDPQVNITEDMVDAGVEALCEMPFGSNPRDIVQRVWLAMVSEPVGFANQLADVDQSRFSHSNGVAPLLKG